MAHTPRPHISAALQHLRAGVTLCACVLACALLAQVVAWGVIHYAAPAETALEQPQAGVATDVVFAAPEAESEGESTIAATPQAVAPATAEPGSASSINTVPSGSGLMIRRFASVSMVVGVAATVGLCLFLFQSVAVAGGGGVPGVEKVVTATTWAMVVAALCVPWSSLLPAVPFEGVLRTGAGFDAASRAMNAGSTSALGFFGQHLVLPLLLVAGVAACALRYRAGVEGGVIVTHASMLDERLEAELRNRKLGEGSTPRAVGALNSALGDTPEPAPAMSSKPVPQHNPSPPMSANHHAHTPAVPAPAPAPTQADPPAVPPPPPMRPI